jgi:hypothetical protein
VTRLAEAASERPNHILLTGDPVPGAWVCRIQWDPSRLAAAELAACLPSLKGFEPSEFR